MRRHAEAVGDVFAGAVSVIGIDCGIDRRIVAARLLESLVRDLETVLQGRIGQRNRRGSRHRARHVADTVVDDAVDGKDRVVMAGHAGGLTAAALIDRDVDNDASRLHLFEIFLFHQLGCGLSGDEHTANDEVRLGHRLLNRRVRAVQRLDARAEQVVQIGQTAEVHIDDRHVRAHADRELARIGADIAAAQNDDFRLRRARYAGEQNAASAEFLLEILGALLNAETSGNLAHRSQQRETAVALHQRLIRHALDARRHQCLHLRLVRRQMQIGEQNQIPMEIRIFLLQRLLDLDHHLTDVPDLPGGLQNHRAGQPVFLRGESGSHAGIPLDVYFMSGIDIRPHVVRRHADTKFIVLDFLYTSNFHIEPSFCPQALFLWLQYSTFVRNNKSFQKKENAQPTVGRFRD